MTNNQKFISLYKTFEQTLKKKYGEGDHTIMNYINKLRYSRIASEVDRGVMLDVIRVLRNGLSHIEDIPRNAEKGEQAYTVNESCIKALEYEIDILERPITVENVMVPISKAAVCTLESNLFDTTQLMRDKGFSNVPVLEDGRLVGVFSESTVFACLVDMSATYVNEQSTLKEMECFLRHPEHNSTTHIFVSRKEEMHDVLDIMSNKKDGKRISMAFVTEHGKCDEKVIGLLTIYDLLK